SATPKKTRLTPNPAENNIPIQVKKGYSGLDSSEPKRIAPYLLMANPTKNIIIAKTINKYNQLKLSCVKVNNVLSTLPNFSCMISPIMTNIKILIEYINKTAFFLYLLSSISCP